MAPWLPHTIIVRLAITLPMLEGSMCSACQQNRGLNLAAPTQHAQQLHLSCRTPEGCSCSDPLSNWITGVKCVSILCTYDAALMTMSSCCFLASSLTFGCERTEVHQPRLGHFNCLQTCFCPQKPMLAERTIYIFSLSWWIVGSCKS